MSKTFTYTILKGQYYLEYSDEFEYDGDDFDYEVDDEKLLDAVVDLIKEYYFDGKLNVKQFKSFVRDFGNLDELADGFYDELKERFEDDAMDYYKDNYWGVFMGTNDIIYLVICDIGFIVLFICEIVAWKRKSKKYKSEFNKNIDKDKKL